jgi:hypothetical protein
MERTQGLIGKLMLGRLRYKFEVNIKRVIKAVSL